MPLSAAMFAEWPVSLDEMEPHYRAILSSIPFAAEQDDLAPIFPLFGTPKPLRPFIREHRWCSMLSAPSRAHAVTRDHGRARPSRVQRDRCVSCGLCLTGCPHSLIYSASQTFDRLIAQRRVCYHDGLVAYRLSESGGKARVDAWEAGANSARTFEADKVYVACGAFGTTRLVLASLERYDQPVMLDESVQFVLPALSARRAPTLAWSRASR